MSKKGCAPIVGMALVAGFYVAPAVAWAENSLARNDQKVAVSPQVMAVFAQMRARQTSVLAEAEIRQVAALLEADGKLDDNEIDLIDELVSSRARVINILPLSGDQQPLSASSMIAFRGRPLLELLDRHYAALYGNEITVQGWEKLVRQSLISESGLARVRDFLTKKAATAIRESVTANAYKPARDLIRIWSVHNKEIAPELQDRGGWLIYLSFRDANDAAAPKVPEFVYSWAKPPPAP